MPYSNEELNKVRLLLYKWGQELLFIEEKQREIATYQTMISTAYDTLKSTKLTGMPRGGHHELTTVEAAADKATSTINQYTEAITRLTEKIAGSIRFREAIGNCIDTLNPDERQIVRLRFEANQQWGYIEATMKLSRSCLAWKESQLLAKLKPRIEVKTIDNPEITIFAQTSFRA